MERCIAVPGLKAPVLFFSVLAPLDERLAQLSFFFFDKKPTASLVLLLVFFSCKSPPARKRLPVSVDEKKTSDMHII